MPGAGFVPYLRTDPQIESDRHVRVETGIREGDTVSVHYDPMIAKLVVWHQDRLQALDKLAAVLNMYQIAGMYDSTLLISDNMYWIFMFSGIKTNVPFLKQLVKHEEFRAGHVHTNFIAQHNKSLFPETSVTDLNSLTCCKFVLAKVLLDTYVNKQTKKGESWSPFDVDDCFRVNLERNRYESVHLGNVSRCSI